MTMPRARAQSAGAAALALGALLAAGLAGAAGATAAGPGGLDVTVNGVPVDVDGALGAPNGAQDYTECDANGTSHTDTLSGYSIAAVIAAAGTTAGQTTSVTIPRVFGGGAVRLGPADYSTPDDFAEGPALIATTDGQRSFFRPIRSGTTCANDTNGPDYVVSSQGNDLVVAIASGTTLSPAATASDTTPSVGQAVTFTGSDSDSYGGTLAYRWTFADGTVVAQQTFSRAFTAAGTDSVTLTVSDAANPAKAGGAAAPLTITVASAPGPTGPPAASASSSSSTSTVGVNASPRPRARSTGQVFADPTSTGQVFADPTTASRPSPDRSRSQPPSATIGPTGTAAATVPVAVAPSAALAPVGPDVPGASGVAPTPELAPSSPPDSAASPAPTDTAAPTAVPTPAPTDTAAPTAPTAPTTPAAAPGVPVSGVLLGDFGPPVAAGADAPDAATPTTLSQAALERAVALGAPSGTSGTRAGTLVAYEALSGLVLCLAVGALTEGKLGEGRRRR